MNWSKLTFLSKALITLVAAGVIGAAVYFLAPGLRTAESKKMDKLDISDKDVNNINTSAEISLPTNEPSADVQNKPLVKVGGYAWNAQSAIIVANGGPKTTKGSLMEKNGVNLEIIRQDWLKELTVMQMKFIEEFDKGEAFPTSDKSAFGIMIMGDGAPFYISSTQKSLDEKYGKDKYHVQVIKSIFT